MLKSLYSPGLLLTGRVTAAGDAGVLRLHRVEALAVHLPGLSVFGLGQGHTGGRENTQEIGQRLGMWLPSISRDVENVDSARHQNALLGQRQLVCTVQVSVETEASQSRAKPLPVSSIETKKVTV